MKSALLTLMALSEPPKPVEYRQALLEIQDAMGEWVGFGPCQLQRRIDALMRIARHDIGLARLSEGHLDALSILEEAGATPEPGALYGIWASGGPADTTHLDGPDVCTLSGGKPFCSGAGLVDRALIWVSDAQRLVEVDLAGNADKVSWDSSNWCVDALAGIQTWTGMFDAVPAQVVDGDGGRDWYFHRPGFWMGALCPAACWAGGAQGLLDYALAAARDNPIAEAHVGRMLAASFGMESALRAASTPLADDLAGLQSAHTRALAVRHLIERASTHIIDEFSRLLGPRPLINMPSIARRIQELQIYLRQCHGDQDLVELSATVRAGDRAACAFEDEPHAGE
ncbi:hypothetical protein [Salinisphaera aquimarina]|uniref:Acyl-CoA dehydrogenase n=1 Tax=Salinisphaera aquimarina TaxID=2094031 RepID=A0ABV7EQH2_9GAMM